MRILAPVTVLGLLGLLGCAEQPPSLGTTAGMSFEEYRAAASAHREPGTGAYIVDGDIVLHGDDALYRYWSRTQQGALTIYAVNGVDVTWDNAQKLNLSYCVSERAAGDWCFDRDARRGRPRSVRAPRQRGRRASLQR
jgi:hypothetical protein